MGNLTDDMTRLCGEIDALRRDRGALMQNLAHGAKDLAGSVMTMRADFSASHAAMAKKARKNRKSFISGLSDEVNTLLEDCRSARGEMAAEDSESRAAFCAGIRQHVADICNETAEDLAGVRLVWRSRSGAMPKGRTASKPKRAVGRPPRVAPSGRGAPSHGKGTARRIRRA